MDKMFKLKSKFSAAGDQPQAIEKIVAGINAGIKHETLLGVTGSGKTFTMAAVIEKIQKPTLVISHNKTLAAQLYSEFKQFFPENTVHYFVSYYDYYQPEAYIPRRDLYIEKETEVNEDIEKYRSAATQSLLSRKDVIIIASVSCIYGLGNPEDYLNLSRHLTVGESYSREKFLRHLGDLQYERSEYDFYNGMYRVRGDTVDVFTASSDTAIRIEFFGDGIESIKVINPLTGLVLSSPREITVFPAKHFVTSYEALLETIPEIEGELKERVKYLKGIKKDLEAARLEQRVRYDIEMLQETGYCSGIENYSRFIDRRKRGTPPSTLLDYYPSDWLLFIDESHMTIPQVRGMYNGDRARKSILVDYGFRLPSALDNRPLRFNEFNSKVDQVIYVSATPSVYEIELSRLSTKKQAGFKEHSGIIEQLIRPTGLLDPTIEIRPQEVSKKAELLKRLKAKRLTSQYLSLKDLSCSNQIDDLINEIQKRIRQGERVLVTTLTKRMAEELATYLANIKIKVHYLHSEIDTIERVEILRDLRLGRYDVLVGINLLREGLDLPEVSLVAILDADKEGFLRSSVSLIQIMGRASRHERGHVIMYANNITDSMENAITETERRRKIQEEFNAEHGIVPKTIKKEITDQLEHTVKEVKTIGGTLEKRIEAYSSFSPKERKQLLSELEVQMIMYADTLEFEKAASIRDTINDLKNTRHKH